MNNTRILRQIRIPYCKPENNLKNNANLFFKRGVTGLKSSTEVTTFKLNVLHLSSQLNHYVTAPILDKFPYYKINHLVPKGLIVRCYYYSSKINEKRIGGYCRLKKLISKIELVSGTGGVHL
jgi:hypothetical protein